MEVPTVRELLLAVVPLVLGGIAQKGFKSFAGPRVYVDFRRRQTVSVLEEAKRHEIERALLERAIPLSYLEIEWWNQAGPAAKDIQVELRGSSPILNWVLTPEKSSLTAGWACLHDPNSAESSDPTRIRIAQPALFAGEHCKLSIEFRDAPEESATVTVTVGDRKVGLPHRLQSIHALVWFATGVALTILGLVAWPKFGSDSGHVPTWLFVVWLGTSFFIARRLLVWLSPGSPSWGRTEQEARKQSRLTTA